MTMGKTCCGAMLGLVLGTAVFGEEISLGFQASDWVAVSALGANYVGVASLLVPDKTVSSVGLGLSFGMVSAPLWFVDPVEGILVTTSITGAALSNVIIPHSPDWDGRENQIFRNIGGNATLKLAMWSGYEAYAKQRLREESPLSVNYHSFADLAGAPWDPQNLSRSSGWVPLLAYTGAAVGISVVRSEKKTAVWDSGRAFWGGREVPLFLGLAGLFVSSAVNLTFTATGEEALYRGVQYQWLKPRLGPVWARVVDSSLFSGIHVPQEVRGGEAATDILLSFAFRGLLSAGLEWAYDEGGLKASVAQHFWIDMTSQVVNYLFTAGVAKAEFAPQLEVGFSY